MSISRRARSDEIRHAFLVSNSNYASEKLKVESPSKDIAALQPLLENCGFKVTLAKDLTTEELRATFLSFLIEIEGADVALLYYSGHGLQWAGNNLIVPIDSPLSVRQLLKIDGLLSIEEMIGRTNVALRTATDATEKTCLVFLDACRTNALLPPAEAPTQPFANPGLAEIDIADGSETFIAYATSPGRVANGTKADLSIFTDALIRHLGIPGLSLDTQMRWAGERVTSLTRSDPSEIGCRNSAQRPWKHDDLTQDFYFRKRDKRPLTEMTILGMVAGVVSSLSIFDSAGSYVPIAHFTDVRALGGLPFACVIGYGAVRWGAGTWVAGLVASSITIAMWTIANIALSPAITAMQGADFKSNALAYVQMPEFSFLVNAILASGSLYAAGTVLAGAATSIALRNATVFAYAVCTGVAVTIIFIVVSVSLRLLTDYKEQSAGGLEFVSLAAATAIWDGILAAISGYAYASYVPANAPDADAIEHSKRPAAKAILAFELRVGPFFDRGRSRLKRAWIKFGLLRGLKLPEKFRSRDADSRQRHISQ